MCREEEDVIDAVIFVSFVIFVCHFLLPFTFYSIWVASSVLSFLLFIFLPHYRLAA